MPELDAIASVDELVDEAEGVGAATADRLDEAGFETVADLLIADVDDLEDVPWVGRERAEQLLDLATTVASPPPREVDFDETESAVQEAAVPLGVRRGEAVLVKRGSSPSTYHTTDCRVANSETMAERSWEYVEHYDLQPCSYCSGEWLGDVSEESESGEDDDVNADTDPLAESPGEVVLEATLGEKLQITFDGHPPWQTDHYVCEVEEPVEWETPLGENWQTRRIGIESGAGQDSTKDLVATGDDVWLYGDRGGRFYRRLEEVATVAVVGRVSSHKHVQLKGRQERANAEAQKPDGDDSWQKYTLEAQEGETA